MSTDGRHNFVKNDISFVSCVIISSTHPCPSFAISFATFDVGLGGSSRALVVAHAIIHFFTEIFSFISTITFIGKLELQFISH